MNLKNYQAWHTELYLYFEEDCYNKREQSSCIKTVKGGVGVWCFGFSIQLESYLYIFPILTADVRNVQI